MSSSLSALSAAADRRSSASLLSRLSILAYGVAVYGIFFATFCYLALFVIGLYVPKTVDDGAVVPLGEALAVNGLLVLAFAVQHAIMARPAFKARWTRVIPKAAERSTFVAVASAILVALFWQWRPIPGTVWQVESAVGQGILYGLFALGFGTVLFSSFLIDHFELFGLRQVWMNFRGQEDQPARFHKRALYKLVRHPLMLGFLVAFWATPHMTWGHLLFASLFTLYILFGTRIEERDLVAHHGEDYLRYRREVPALLPVRFPGR